jgi:hypothetical protein
MKKSATFKDGKIPQTDISERRFPCLSCLVNRVPMRPLEKARQQITGQKKPLRKEEETQGIERFWSTSQNAVVFPAPARRFF